MGEEPGPISYERRPGRAAEMRALRDVVAFSLILGTVVMINTVIGVALIEIFGSLAAHETGVPALPGGVLGNATATAPLGSGDG